MSKEKKVIRLSPDDEPPMAERNKRRKVDTQAVVTKFCNADECISFHLVRTANDLHGDDDELSFPPEFSERFFGEDGRIYGYKGLKIDVWLHAVSFHAHANIHYDAKLRDGGPGNPTADLPAKMKEIFDDALIADRDAFLETIPRSTDSFLQILQEEGTILSSWRSDSEGKSMATDATDGKLRQIVRLELRDARVRKWYSCLTPLILLFIEGGRPIESDDPLWEIYVTLEGEGPEIVVTGFCTVYRFYHYPDSMRLRVSQILVLPPYQGQGYGFRLLETINRIANERNCYDITFEDPSASLQELRDCMDVLRLLVFPPAVAALNSAMARFGPSNSNEGKRTSASEHGQNNVETGCTTNGKSKASHVSKSASHEKNVLLPPSKLVEEARKSLKISKAQLKRCWESLLFQQLESASAAAQETFRELLVKRLHSEIFSKGEEAVGRGKKVIDVENEYDSDKTFIMMKTGDQANGSESTGAGDLVDESDEEKKLQVLQELLEERETELQAVADKVSSRRKRLGIPVNGRDLQ